MISKTIDLAGQTLHYADFGGKGTTVVLVHGLGGSHANWLAVGSGLAQHNRVVAIDLPGFGRSGPNPRGNGLPVLCETLTRFIDAMSPAPVHLVGNSMGGALSILEAHARPSRISSTLLVCPALPRPPGKPHTDRAWAGTMLLSLLPGGHRMLRRRATRLGPERQTRELLALCCVDASRVPRNVVEAHVALAIERARSPWIQSAFAQSARSLLREAMFGTRLREALRQPRPPMLIVQGRRDRLVDLRAARAVAAANPRIELLELADVGHVPQLEVPEVFLDVATRWLKRTDSPKDAKPAATQVA